MLTPSIAVVAMKQQKTMKSPSMKEIKSLTLNLRLKTGGKEGTRTERLDYFQVRTAPRI